MSWSLIAFIASRAGVKRSPWLQSPLLDRIIHLFYVNLHSVERQTTHYRMKVSRGLDLMPGNDEDSRKNIFTEFHFCSRYLREHPRPNPLNSYQPYPLRSAPFCRICLTTPRNSFNYCVAECFADQCCMGD